MSALDNLQTVKFFSPPQSAGVLPLNLSVNIEMIINYKMFRVLSPNKYFFCFVFLLAHYRLVADERAVNRMAATSATKRVR